MKEGGIFTILDNCLQNLALYNSNNSFDVIALVGEKSKFDYQNITFLEFPKSKKSWFFRIYYEYFYFKKLSKNLKPDIWLSLHDISPNVVCKNRFVYCHHPTLFYKPTFKDWRFDSKIGVFSIFYKYLQQINIKKNNAVFVQQNWIKAAFEHFYNIQNIIVAKPEFEAGLTLDKIDLDPTKTHFFYPSFPRSFKNFEIIFEAIQLLDEAVSNQIIFHFTLDSTKKNNYTQYLLEKYKNNKNVNFTGVLSKNEMLAYYNAIDCLLFSSKLETWGLPISEAKAFKKPMLLANLPYAKETVGDYEKVSFFDVNNPHELADLMTEFVKKTIKYQGNVYQYNTKEQLNNWFELFDYITK
jgi:glycosyltransferase involved in cell wall biosynthesis